MNNACQNATEIPNDELPYMISGQTLTAIPLFQTCTNTSACGKLKTTFFPKRYSGNWFKVKGTGDKMQADTCDDTTNFDTIMQIFENCSINCIYSV